MAASMTSGVAVPQRSDACAAIAVGQAQPLSEVPSDGRFEVVQAADRLEITHSGNAVAQFVFRDPNILRPYLCQVHSPSGIQVTRIHPPIPEQDATDHATMHPGIWYGFGDINGVDFWRNKGKITHVRFDQVPEVSEDRMTFSTISRLVAPSGDTIGEVTNQVTLIEADSAWLLLWNATFQSADQDLVFGDQEEMGFGARLATPLTETNGGVISNSTGLKSAAKTWGQSALWSDYMGMHQGQPVGITLMAAPENFRQSWWHNRNYGLTVANPFGRNAMTGGEKSRIVVSRDTPWTIRFAAAIHDGPDYDPQKAWMTYTELLTHQRSTATP